MNGAFAQFAVDVGSAVAAALVLAIANAVRNMARSVRESTTATQQLVGSVHDLQGRVARLEDDRGWPLPSWQHPNEWNGKRYDPHP